MSDKSKPRVDHPRIAAAVREILLAASELGIGYLTVYAFSAENWRRPQTEVEGLMKLIERAARDELRLMHVNNVRIRVAGRMSEVPTGLQEALRHGIETTKDNTGITFTLAINYGFRTVTFDASLNRNSSATDSPLNYGLSNTISGSLLSSTRGCRWRTLGDPKRD